MKLELSEAINLGINKAVSNMRIIEELARMDGRVLAYLCNKTLARKFLEDATKEGFIFGNGVKPIDRPGEDIYAVHRNFTKSFIGWAGHMAFHNPDRVIGELII